MGLYSLKLACKAGVQLFLSVKVALCASSAWSCMGEFFWLEPWFRWKSLAAIGTVLSFTCLTSLFHRRDHFEQRMQQAFVEVQHLGDSVASSLCDGCV